MGEVAISRGVRLGKNDFTPVSGMVLQKNCAFLLGFNFTKLTVVSVFFQFVILHSTVNAIFHFIPLRNDTRNDVLPCRIDPNNCQPKWFTTRSAEIWLEEK